MILVKTSLSPISRVGFRTLPPLLFELFHFPGSFALSFLTCAEVECSLNITTLADKDRVQMPNMVA